MSTNDLNQDLICGLVYTHNRSNGNTAEIHQTSAKVQALIELLIESGVINQDRFEERCRDVSEQLRKRYLAQGMGTASQDFGVSKYDFHKGAEVDCKNLISRCKAACCKLPLALSKEDVQEGIVRWELGQPYMIAHGADGYCVHMDRQTHGCTVYENRPIPCRGYDCRQDKRIWLDFENKVINPKINDPDWPHCLESEAVSSPGRENEHGSIPCPSKIKG